MTKFSKDLSKPNPIPESGIAAAIRIMKTGKLHRYGEIKSGSSIPEAMQLEKEFAEYMGLEFCVGVNSCGCSIFLALKAVGVQFGDQVLMNAFTLAPVPGAIAHCGAQPVLVEVDETNYTICLEDLKKKASSFENASGVKVLLLSHMRGHIVGMEALEKLCDELKITMVEDCAHTMAASWNGRLTGTFGKVGCFSTQTFKHINSGEGGLLVTNDQDVAAKVILYSGSYMLYKQHGARPEEAIFAKWKAHIPNFSMRMSNLAAAVARPQLKMLKGRSEAWMSKYLELEAVFDKIENIKMPTRAKAKEHFVPSSVQFLAENLEYQEMIKFQAGCAERGLTIKWFGHDDAIGFTSRYEHWGYVQKPDYEMPSTNGVMRRLFDMRIPMSMTDEDVELIGKVVQEAMQDAKL